MIIQLLIHSAFALLSPQQARQFINNNYYPDVTVLENRSVDSMSKCEVFETKLNVYTPVFSYENSDQFKKPQTISDVQSWPFTIEHYRPKERTKKHAIIIHPPTGGVTAINRNYARLACKRGYEVVIALDNVEAEFPTIAPVIHDIHTYRGVTSLSQILEYIQLPALCYGESLGAITCSAAMGFDDRFKGGVLVVGGSEFLDVIATSQHDILVDLKTKRKAAWGFESDRQYKFLLDQNVNIDPGLFYRPELKNKISVYASTKDKVVPPETQIKMWENWGKPIKISSSLGHVELIGSMYLKGDDVFDFFDKADRDFNLMPDTYLAQIKD